MSEGARPRDLTTTEDIDRLAPEPGYVTSRSRRKSLSRPRDNRWIAGVCSGLGYRFGLPPNLVRVLFVLSCLLPGPQVLVYILLWIIMPGE
jgi:phage shock protein PspC (stress-responsive transcriptional regulator)